MNVAGIALRTVKRLPTPLGYRVLDQAMARVIPFNRGMGLRIEALDELGAVVSLPWRRRNANHLRGQHACAIATLGEYCSGIWVAWNFGPDRFRLVMRQLVVDYHSQGKTRLVGTMRADDVAQRLLAHPPDEKCDIALVTHIVDDAAKHVATVSTQWQIKPWDQVAFK